MTSAQINSLERRAETAEQQCQELRTELKQYREQIKPVLDYLSKQWPGSIGSNLRQLQKMVGKT